MKIGSAFDINKRLNSYQTACPHRAYRLEASAFVRNRVKSERELLDLFQADRHLGEWFRVDPRVVARVITALHHKERK